jgi:hypothetical protein
MSDTTARNPDEITNRRRQKRNFKPSMIHHFLTFQKVSNFIRPFSRFLEVTFEAAVGRF